MTATEVESRPERIYPPYHFEANDEMPEEYRDLVIRLLRETNEIGSVPVCVSAMEDMAHKVDLAPDPVSRVRMIEFYADEMRHQKIFDGVVHSMGIEPDDDFVSSITALNAGSVIDDWVDMALLNTLIDRVGAFQLLDYAESSFAPLARAGTSVARDELGHCAMGYQHLRELCATEDGRRKAAERLPVWYGYALDMFGTSTGTRQHKYLRYGLKTKLNEEQRQNYIVHIGPYLEAVGLEQPGPNDVPRMFA